MIFIEVKKKGIYFVFVDYLMEVFRNGMEGYVVDI